jgi:hypothetical protein
MEIRLNAKNVSILAFSSNIFQNISVYKYIITMLHKAQNVHRRGTHRRALGNFRFMGIYGVQSAKISFKKQKPSQICWPTEKAVNVKKD